MIHRPTSLAGPSSTAGDEAPPTLDEQLGRRLQEQRILVLGSAVDDAVAHRLCAQLLLLSVEDPRRPITLWINSPGGSVTAGLAVYDTMRALPNEVTTVALGLAASMGQFLLCAGTPGRRFALPHARVMMHQPSGGIGGTAADIAIQAENLAHTKATLQRLIAEHTGQDVATVEADSARDRWFTAEEARAYGLVDEVLTSLADLPATRDRKVGL
ncbi:ClpP family protease [Kineococcus gynurae]|uniref:ATP-dependent Clp protease proteolytic subunit n=1 Tax=Kineococcus gynurae TaxID=452979 RepID=A0ABV5LPY1_9ACTN